MINLIVGAWNYRNFIFTSIKTEFQIRFIRSGLGGFWMILNPLAQVLMFALVLSTVMSAKLPGITNRYAYSIYLMSGILGWSLFTEIVTKCMTLFIDNGNILKKLVFPKITLPLIVTGSALVNNILLFIAIITIFGILGHYPGSALIWLPILTLLNVCFALGCGLIVGVLNVFIRDVGQMIPIVLQFLFWLTPIVYMVNIIPKHWHWLLSLNPLVPIIQGYQKILLNNEAPLGLGLYKIAFIAIILIFFSLMLFRRASAEMVDQL